MLRALIPGVLSFAVLFRCGLAGAAPPSAQLLPATTKLHLSVPNLKQFDDAWDQTQFARMLADPKLRPFADQLRQRADWMGTGLRWEDLKAAASGEFSWATILPAPGQAAHVLTLDTTGKAKQAEALVRQAAANLEKQGFRRLQAPAGMTSVLIYHRQPGGETAEARLVVCLLKDNLFFLCDNWGVVTGILGRWAGNGADSLAGVRAYQEVLKRARTRVKDRIDLTWFIEPLGLAEARRIAEKQTRPRGPDLLKVLKNEGFGAFQGVGGYVTFGLGEYDLLLHTAVYAPPPYVKSMRMMCTFTGADFRAPAWVPGDLAVYGTVYVDLKNGFETFGSFFDAFVAEGDDGSFDTIVKDMRDDPNGPRVDLARDVIGRLGNKVTLVGDVELPITNRSDRLLAAAPTTDEKGVATALQRLFQNDQDVVRHEVQNRYVIWEMTNRPKKGETAKTPGMALTVAHGHLFVSTHAGLLQKILTGQITTLAQEADYARVAAEIERLGGGEASIRLFSRTDRDGRMTYEALRRNNLSEAKSFYAQVLVRLLPPLGPAALDGRRLPEFEQVRSYLRPAGAFATNTPDGWLWTGFVLKQ